VRGKKSTALVLCLILLTILVCKCNLSLRILLYFPSTNHYLY